MCRVFLFGVLVFFPKAVTCLVSSYLIETRVLWELNGINVHVHFLAMRMLLLFCSLRVGFFCSIRFSVLNCNLSCLGMSWFRTALVISGFIFLKILYHSLVGWWFVLCLEGCLSCKLCMQFAVDWQTLAFITLHSKRLKKWKLPSQIENAPVNSLGGKLLLKKFCVEILLVGTWALVFMSRELGITILKPW